MIKSVFTIATVFLLLSVGMLAAFDHKESVAKHTYKLSLNEDGSKSCLVPIVDTEKFAITAAHCVAELRSNGYKTFYGVNNRGDIKTFTLKKFKYVKYGLDYAILEDKVVDGGVPIRSSHNLKKGDSVYIYSPKRGLVHTTLNRNINAYNSVKFYVNSVPADCGCSGSGVYNSDGELVGIFVARTYPNDGVVLRIEAIMEDLNKD